VRLATTRTFSSRIEFVSFKAEIQHLFDQCCAIEMGYFGLQLKDPRQAMTILDFHEVHLLEGTSVILAFKNATTMQNGKMLDKDLATKLTEIFPEKCANKT
jgi:hypothetical protein